MCIGTWAGRDCGLFQDLGAAGVILRDAVSLCQRDKALGVCRDLIEQLGLEIVALFHQCLDLFFDVCVFLLADGQRADHVAECRAERGHERGCAAAAGGRFVGSQNRDKFTAGLGGHIHKIFS